MWHGYPPDKQPGLLFWGNSDLGTSQNSLTRISPNPPLQHYWISYKVRELQELETLKSQPLVELEGNGRSENRAKWNQQWGNPVDTMRILEEDPLRKQTFEWLSPWRHSWWATGFSQGKNMRRRSQSQAMFFTSILSPCSLTGLVEVQTIPYHL